MTQGGPAVAGRLESEALGFATRLARRAGAHLLAGFGRLGAGDISYKGRKDIVTRVDAEVEDLVVGAIRRRFPDHGVTGEEKTSDPPGEGWHWYIDPLDGTLNYVHGLPYFAVSIALYLGSEPRLGVVYLPRLEELFSAVAGGGAWQGGQRLRVSERADLGTCLVATGFAGRRGEGRDPNVQRFVSVMPHVEDLRRWGSAASDLAYVAAGRFDGFWEPGLASWDVAAGALLVREAGGRVTDFEGDEQWLASGRIVASNGHVHEDLRRIVSEGTE